MKMELVMGFPICSQKELMEIEQEIAHLLADALFVFLANKETEEEKANE